MDRRKVKKKLNALRCKGYVRSERTRKVVNDNLMHRAIFVSHAKSNCVNRYQEKEIEYFIIYILNIFKMSSSILIK